MVKGKIEYLRPGGHRITIKRGTARPGPASALDLLGRNDRLNLPSNHRQANLSFLDDRQGNRAIHGYHLVVRTPRWWGGTYRLPCRVSGQAALFWRWGSSSGCSSVLVRGLTGSRSQVQNSDVVTASANDVQVPHRHWATTYLQELVDKNILAGYPGGELKPDNAVTREEFASMVAAANRYFQIEETRQTTAFRDVPDQRWSHQVIGKAVRAGFLSGYPTNDFKPTQNISLEQAMVSLASGLGLIDASVDPNKLRAYDDWQAVSSWALEGVSAAIAAGLVIKPEAKQLRPQQNATRAEIATLIYRALHHSSPLEKYLQPFDPADETEDETAGGPETQIEPQTQNPTLTHTSAEAAESPRSIVVTNLAATVRVNARTIGSETVAASAASAGSSEWLARGQRYRYGPTADGNYRGHLSLVSRQERQELVNSAEIKALLDKEQWPDNPPDVREVQTVVQELLKQSPVRHTQESARGIRFRKTIIDLTDPDTLLTIGLGQGADYEAIYDRKNPTYGNEPFSQMVQRYRSAAVVASGTFFNKSTTGPNANELYGNMIGSSEWLRYQRWEKRGTALLIGEGNRPEMITLHQTDDTFAPWERTWFYLTAGPRLLRAGEISLNPESEGFQTPSLVDIHQANGRAVLAFPQDGSHLCLVTFTDSLSLQKAATIMKDMGYYEAMNLDGGASIGLAVDGQTVRSPSRDLTHALVVYDSNHLAPPDLLDKWNQFQLGNRRLERP